MKIRLLENPGYGGLDRVAFPVEVEAEVEGARAFVPSTELYRVGATDGFKTLKAYCFPSTVWERPE